METFIANNVSQNLPLQVRPQKTSHQKIHQRQRRYWDASVYEEIRGGNWCKTNVDNRIDLQGCYRT